MSDKNFFSLPRGGVGTVDLGDLIPPDDFKPHSDTLKGSGATDGTVTAGIVEGGLEDCLDLNNGCARLSIFAKEWRSGGMYVATLKGHLRDVRIGGTITKHGSVVDVDIDNYGDQSHRMSDGIMLCLRTNDGSPVTWRSWRGAKPILLNADVQAYRCVFRLPAWIGFLANSALQTLKMIGLVK